MMNAEIYFPFADIEELEIGMSASYSQIITETDITIFAGASGDKKLRMLTMSMQKSRGTRIISCMA